MNAQNNPLVSFCLLFHNQRTFVADALRGAFEQTYSPLEIVISDDGSTDGTWDVIQGLVDDYRRAGGSHAVVLNRNEKNLGRLENRLKVFSLAHGELFVSADGDDISCPERVAHVVACWQAHGGKPVAIVNGAMKMSHNGRRTLGLTSESWATQTPGGGLTTYSRCVYDAFANQPICVRDGVDDDVLGYRVRLLGDLVYVAEPLVLYRTGVGVSSGVLGYRRRMVRLMKNWVNDVPQFRSDCLYARSWISEACYRRWLSELAHGVARIELDMALWDGEKMAVRFSAFRKIIAQPYWRLGNAFYLILLFPRALSGMILDLLRIFSYCHAYMRGKVVRKGRTP